MPLSETLPTRAEIEASTEGGGRDKVGVCPPASFTLASSALPPAISKGTKAFATRMGPAAFTAKHAASAAGEILASAVSGAKSCAAPVSGSPAVPWRTPEALIRRSSLPCELETVSAAASIVERRVTSRGRTVSRGRDEEELPALDASASAASSARAVAEEGSRQVATTASNLSPPPRTSWRVSSRPRPVFIYLFIIIIIIIIIWVRWSKLGEGLE